MRKVLLLLAAALVGTLQASADIRPRHTFKKWTQSDGSTITVRRVDNSRYFFYVTKDGKTLLPNEKGDLCYTKISNGTVVNTEQPAQEAKALTTLSLNAVGTTGNAAEVAAAFENAYPTNYLPGYATRATASTADGLGRYGLSGGGTVSSIGQPTIPIIMAEFSDKQFQDTINAEKLNRMFNEAGYHDEANCVGSVRDYFLSQSNGLFAPTFNVVAKVQLSNGYAYYGADSKSGTTDARKYDFAQEALNLAAAQGVDFSKYTVDGAVPNVAIYYAGPGQQSSFEEGCDDYLWARFSTRSFTVNGTKISSFFMGNELLQYYQKADGSAEYSDANKEFPIPQSAMIDGIGVFCHEFSHALGLPDAYYTGSNQTIYDTLNTMYYWSIMDYGQYALTTGYTPIGYTAYERSFMGWLDVKELDSAQVAKLYAFDDERVGDDEVQAYVIRNDANDKEYYILENRQPSTWYPAAMGHGLLITHIDYNTTSWSNNVINNVPSHQRYAYVPADNSKAVKSTKDLKGDLFPGTTESAEFTDDTTPASSVFTTTNGGKLGKPVYDITEADGIITFTYLDKSLTGIKHAVTNSDNTCGIFSLDGRRVDGTVSDGKVSGVAPGLYIVNGKGKAKKVLVK